MASNLMVSRPVTSKISELARWANFGLMLTSRSYELRGPRLEKAAKFLGWREGPCSESMDQTFERWFLGPGGTAMVPGRSMGGRSYKIQRVKPREVKWYCTGDVEKAIIIERCG